MSAAIVAALAGASTAEAHGVAAAVTGVAAAGPDGPSVVLVSEGLVQRLGGEWRYVCPAQFGGELGPPALSVDGVHTFVVGQDDLFVLAPDGTVTRQGEPSLSRQFVVGLGVARGQLYAFRFEGGSAEIRAVNAPSAPPLWRGDQTYDSLSADDGGFWVAHTDGVVGHATRLDLAGVPVGDHTFTVDPGDFVDRVAEIQGSVYVSILTPNVTGRLLRLGADGGSAALLATNAPLAGPLALEAGAGFVIADGVLETLGGGSPAPASAESATCLGQVGGLAYLCSRTRLLALTPAGPTDLLLALADLKGPRLDLVSPDAGDSCALQWLVFQNDLRMVGALPPADAGAPQKGGGTMAAPESRSSGCAVGRANGSPTGFGALALFAGVVAVIRARRGRR